MIYDEAIELENEIKENRLQLTKEKYRDLDDIKLNKIIKSKSDKHDKVIKALERAKKEHELLGLYREKDKLRDEFFNEYSSIYSTTQSLNKILNGLKQIQKQIEALEKELGKLK